MCKIDNKYYKAKIKNLEERLDSQKYNTKKITKSIRKYMKFSFKIGSFFFAIVSFWGFFVIVGYKNEN